jgi:hypothetical protein
VVAPPGGTVRGAYSLGRVICGYCLKNLPKEHVCPECGTQYEIEEVKGRWSEYLNRRATRKLSD